MTDVVVTLPRKFGLKKWIEEGCAAGEQWDGQTYYYWRVPTTPKISPGERVYVVYKNKLIGFSPLVGIQYGIWYEEPYLVRAGDAQAVTIDPEIKGFQGYRYRWWDREEERPFPDWRELQYEGD